MGSHTTERTNNMKEYRISEYIAYFSSPIERVFELISNNESTAWRSDLDHVECIDDTHFIEYTKKQEATHFTITKKIAPQYYAFTMENKMFSGKWTGTFLEENGKTKVILVEYIHVHNPILRLLSYVLMDLKKMQKQYVSDVQKALGESCDE